MNHISIRLMLYILVLSFSWDIPTKIFAQPSEPRFKRDEKMGMTSNHGPLRKLKSVAYGNSLFVAIGPNMTILTSDGKSWVNRSSEIKNVTANINFASETYTANGDAVTFVFDSATKKTQAYQSIFPSVPRRLYAVTFGGGTFVIVGDSGEILTSHDGDHWITPDSNCSDILTGVTWGSAGFVAVGDKGAILTSPDGSSWTKQNSGTDATIFGVAYGNGIYVALGGLVPILWATKG